MKYDATSITNPTCTEARSNIDFIEVISMGTGTVADNSIGPHVVPASHIEGLGTPTSQAPIIPSKHSAPIIRVMRKIQSSSTSDLRRSEINADEFEDISLRIAAK